MADGDLGAVRRTARPGRDDHAEIIISGAQLPRGATNTPSAVSADRDAVSSAVSSHDRDALDRALWTGRTLRGLRDAASPQTHRDLIDTIIAAGWRPVPAWQWGYRLDVQPADFAVEASEATARLEADEPGTVLVRRPVGEWEVVDRG